MTHSEPAVLGRRALELVNRYQLTGDLAMLRESVDLLRLATAMERPPPTRVANLGAALNMLYTRTGDPALVVESVAACRLAVTLAPRNPLYLSNLAAGLELQFQATSDQGRLVEAVLISRKAVAETSLDDASLVGRLGNLCNSLRSLYLQTSDIEALRESVAVGRRAASLITEGTVAASMVLSNLANALWALSDRTGDDAVMVEAVDAYQAALDATPLDHPDRPAVLSNLAYRRSAVAVRASDTAGLRTAVALARHALAATPPDDPDLAHNESGLAAVLRAAFNHTGDVHLLAESATLARSALGRTNQDNADLSGRFAELGVTLRALYERTGELSAAVAAVEATTRAVQTAPPGHTSRPGNLINAANARLVLFERTGDGNALREAVLLGRRAAAELSDDHARRLGDQAQAIAPLVALATLTGDPSLLDEAVDLGRRASTLPEGDADLAAACSNYAYALVHRYRQTGSVEDLNEAVALAGRAVGAESADSVQYPAILVTLAGIQLELAERQPSPDMLAAARSTLTELTGSPVATALQRVQAWRNLGRVELLAGAAGAALAAMEQAVSLMPLLAPRALSRGDREFGLGQSTGLAATAAAAAVIADRPDRAVELVEQARTLLQAETIDVRSDLRVLRKAAPDLEREFHRIRHALDAADHPVMDRILTVSPARRTELSRQWADLLAEIRSRPGMERFLLAPSIRQLQEQAGPGPVVLVYTSRWRSDALVLRPDIDRPVQVVPLPGVFERLVIKQAARFESAQRTATSATTYAARKAAHGELHGVLSWLWDNVTGPVLDALGLTGLPEDCRIWPRVWWYPVGLLSTLPLHAAGHHDDMQDDPPDRQRSVIDCMVSSYTTSIRSLAHARRTAGSQTASALVVAMPETPGATALTSAADEATVVSTLVSGSTVLTGQAATRDTVLAALPRHSIAHFACHAMADSADPGASHLLLHDYETNALTVETLSQLDLADVDLAFLSACHTSETVANLADEAIHITSAFQIAGYRNVIGTLTPVNATAAQIAAAVYGFLTLGGTIPPFISDSALALHHAVRLIRATYPAAPMTWAASIHVGV